MLQEKKLSKLLVKKNFSAYRQVDVVAKSMILKTPIADAIDNSEMAKGMMRVEMRKQKRLLFQAWFKENFDVQPPNETQPSQIQ